MFLVEIPGDVEYNLGRISDFLRNSYLSVPYGHSGSGSSIPGASPSGSDDGSMREGNEEAWHHYLLVTVTPDNPYSLSNVRKRGYQIRKTKEKYGGSLRHILCKEV